MNVLLSTLKPQLTQANVVINGFTRDQASCFYSIVQCKCTIQNNDTRNMLPRMKILFTMLFNAVKTALKVCG